MARLSLELAINSRFRFDKEGYTHKEGWLKSQKIVRIFYRSYLWNSVSHLFY